MPISREQALAAAATITGLGGTPAIAPGATAGDRTPFLGREVAALGQAWELRWQDVRLTLPSARGGNDQYTRLVLVRLSQATGQLLSASLRAAALPSGVRPTPEGDLAQEQLRRANESYRGLPSAPPRYSLVSTLDTLLARGIGNPLRTAEIQVLYVMHSHRNRPPIPAWVITLNGIPPLSPSGPAPDQVPLWQRNHLRVVVEASTGQPLFANTVPQPIQPPQLVS